MRGPRPTWRFTSGRRIAMSARRVIVREEEWPIKGTFTIARNSKTSAEVTVVEIHQDGQRG